MASKLSLIKFSIWSRGSIRPPLSYFILWADVYYKYIKLLLVKITLMLQKVKMMIFDFKYPYVAALNCQK